MSTTIEELDEMCRKVKELANIRDQKNEEKKEAEKTFQIAQQELITLLEKHGKTEYQTPEGKFKISAIERWKITNKDDAVTWLKDIGKFDDLASVNANTFSAFVKDLVHKKREEGDFVWCPPGVEDATTDYKKVKIS